MLTFSLNKKGSDQVYIQRVWEAVLRNRGLFMKYNSNDWEEAIHRAFLHAVEQQDERYKYSELDPYIKSLARNILRTRQVKTEIPESFTNDEGEISFNFLNLVTNIDEQSIAVNVEEIQGVFEELYLLDEGEFKKLRYVFLYNEDEKVLTEHKIRNEVFRRSFYSLLRKYGSEVVFSTLYDFFMRLPHLLEQKPADAIKEVYMKEGNFAVVDKIDDLPCIRTEDGKIYGIDKRTLTMSIDPDLVKWDVIFNTNCDILKIDMTPLLDYMYTQIFVPEGVSTRHIKWCGSKYKLISPGGFEVIGEDRHRFMSQVRVELILNLIMNNINKVIALSPESVYIKPTRATPLNTVRLYLVTGKVIDLPVTVYLKKKNYNENRFKSFIA